MQIVRSIDSKSMCGPVYREEMSILAGMVQLVRGARRFLYIENQYWVGSANAWEEPNGLSDNPIPLEVAERIV